ncbi:MAG: HAD-IA family hydrolase [Gemmatimonadota bacterium]|nr:HAD-IA family hydrolase [Gemmatimonadota bacterium]
MNQYSTVFFDLDGTLTDPKEGITRCIQYALDQLGEPSFSQDELASCIGPPLRESFGRLLQTNDTARKEQALKLYRDRFATVGLFENIVYPGVRELLADLGSMRVFLATSKPRVYAERILSHFELAACFHGIYGSEMDGRFEKKPDLLQHMLTLEHLSAESTLMVGDRDHDIIGARQNACGAMGVTYGYGSIEELSSAQADHICHSPEEVAAFLGRC